MLIFRFGDDFNSNICCCWLIFSPRILFSNASLYDNNMEIYAFLLFLCLFNIFWLCSISVQFGWCFYLAPVCRFSIQQRVQSVSSLPYVSVGNMIIITMRRRHIHFVYSISLFLLFVQ